MRVILLISNFSKMNTGIGGHYYSVLATAEALAEAGHAVRVVCIGDRPSPVLSRWESGVCDFIPVNARKTAMFLPQFRTLISEFKPDVIHGFDMNASLFGRIAALLSRTYYAHTLCGGKAPKGWRHFPFVRNLVVYSAELQEHFRDAFARDDRNLALIANRVRAVTSPEERLSLFREHITPGALVILRISRIHPYFERSIRQTLSLGKLLRSQGVKCQVVILGHASDAGSMERIKAILPEEDRLVSDPELAHNAKELNGAADWVVGTGRSFMEAASLGKVMLCPSADQDLPILITPQTFDAAFAANFSERVTVDLSEEANRAEIIKEAKKEEKESALASLSKEYFETHFSIDRLAQKYEKFYAKLQASRVGDFKDWPIQAASFLKRNITLKNRY